MKQLTFLTGCCLFLFFLNAFILNNNTISTFQKQNIIACGPLTTGNITGKFDGTQEIAINDNRKTAGELRNGVLFLKLETRIGNWYPETHEGDPLQVCAFAETGKTLQLPGPLIRVPEGAIINAEIHNSIPGPPLVLHGFYSRPGNEKDSVKIAFNETYKVQFKAGKAGTYMYWASDGSVRTPFNNLPFLNDSQLFGAFIVDAPNIIADPQERIFIIGLWNDTTKTGEYTNDREELAINGLTWPFTERLIYPKDVPVHWRVINASNQDHPMHLHGFFYTVNSRGNEEADTIYKEQDRYLSVTELLKPHQTIAFTWTPDREGNWLFHCHTLFHLMAGSFLRKMPEMTDQEMTDINTHAAKGMGGLIMGISILPSINEVKKAPDEKIAERELTMIIKEKKNYYDTLNGYGFVLREGNASTDTSGSIPGPSIILERDKPVAIKIINHLHEPTTIHWHGLEIESYYDGVSGWGNRGKELAPMIMPGDSFVVHMTPPRAGTFYYHTHMHNFQVFEGLYGAFIVTEPNEKYNSTTDKVFLFSQDITAVFTEGHLLLNGKSRTDTMTLHPGKNYRFRFINTTGYLTDLNVSILLNDVPVNWRAFAKDGAYLPTDLQIIKPAKDECITVGQTRDFEFDPEKKGDYVFAVKDFTDSIVLRKVLRVQ
ncbi:multicopper oxidase domain-containing protein [Panacibacter ginsenosidivorans]|nr:multicopper oxidase domain-containing protein [Panacibacter ginsenosidivorans]